MTATASGGVGEPAEAEGPQPPLQLVPEADEAQVIPLPPVLNVAEVAPAAGTLASDLDLVVVPGISRGPGSGPVKRRRFGSLAAAVMFDFVAVSASVGIGLGCAVLLGAPGIPAGVWGVLVPVILVCFLIHGLYRSNTLRLIPSGVAVFSTAAHAMPLGNLTAMTEDERATVLMWIGHGAQH